MATSDDSEADDGEECGEEKVGDMHNFQSPVVRSFGAASNRVRETDLEGALVGLGS